MQLQLEEEARLKAKNDRMRYYLQTRQKCETIRHEKERNGLICRTYNGFTQTCIDPEETIKLNKTIPDQIDEKQ